MTPPLTLRPNHTQESVVANEFTSTQIFGVMDITLTGLIDSMVPASRPWALTGKLLSYIGLWAVHLQVPKNPTGWILDRQEPLHEQDCATTIEGSKNGPKSTNFVDNLIGSDSMIAPFIAYSPPQLAPPKTPSLILCAHFNPNNIPVDIRLLSAALRPSEISAQHAHMVVIQNDYIKELATDPSFHKSLDLPIQANTNCCFYTTFKAFLQAINSSNPSLYLPLATAAYHFMQYPPKKYYCALAYQLHVPLQLSYFYMKDTLMDCFTIGAAFSACGGWVGLVPYVSHPGSRTPAFGQQLLLDAHP
ncbi:hypothetical protein DSO57_1033125 [Entomophthora muscae]|uniref:Uncharacterized protein n=1 Tax=Entomophthora muscae TaxID=34485 RepID=A0ACC2U9V1_9FUNG|nr:hypothetical protein DSO57_1033125 [Entomophthora muscae]